MLESPLIVAIGMGASQSSPNIQPKMPGLKWSAAVQSQILFLGLPEHICHRQSCDQQTN